MAGRIRDDDIALVREKARIDEIVRDYVTLKPAGGGSLKGLCPFHDERSPSFHVTPSRGMYYCFGCQEGGDVISFVQKLDHLTFAEAVEKLAGRTGVTLRYTEGGAGVNRQQGQRTRLVEANKAAEDYFIGQLTSPDAAPARAFLTERGFDAAVAEDFHLGFAPKSWDSLMTHLRQRGFTDAEMLAAGLVSQGNRGVYDRFRGRLIWPIRDLAGDVVGFGARKLLEDDDGPKYLNTPETPLYKKSQVLYGVDRARREISKQQRAVIVEGYTDVMACHLAGVPVAVATCGTAFGGDHIRC
jgi:DNA primase